MAGLAWFRMYSEFATDPKVQSMEETLQRRFVMFLCLHCAGEFERLSDEELAFALRITVDEVAKTKDIFKRKCFLDKNGKISNWNKRQFKSDSSTKRVKEHRERKRNVSVTTGNGAVTPSDTDTDTDTDTEKRERRARKKVKATKRVPQDFAPDLAYASSQIPDIDAAEEAAKFRDWEFKSPRSDWAATWRTWVRRCKETGSYARARATGSRPDWMDENGVGDLSKVKWQ